MEPLAWIIFILFFAAGMVGSLSQRNRSRWIGFAVAYLSLMAIVVSAFYLPHETVAFYVIVAIFGISMLGGMFWIYRDYK